jgi:hypothetical protein
VFVARGVIGQRRGARWEAWRAEPRAPAERHLDATMFHANGYPNLQAWVRRFNGYLNIPWDLWDAAVKKARSW